MRKLFILVAIAALPMFSYAQPPDPGGDPDETPIPFDGGLSLAIAAGVGYGVKKAYAARKKKSGEEAPKKWFDA